MNRWVTWRDRLPLPAFFGVVFVLWTGIRIVLVLTDGTRVTPSLIVIEVIGGLVFAGVMTALIAWRRRRAGGASTFSEMNQAVRTGKLPENAEPSVWGPELERRRRSLARSRITGPVVFGLFALLGVVLLVTGMNPILAVILIVFFLGFAVYTVSVGARYLRRVESLQRQLDPRASAAPVPAPSPSRP